MHQANSRAPRFNTTGSGQALLMEEVTCMQPKCHSSDCTVFVRGYKRCHLTHAGSSVNPGQRHPPGYGNNRFRKIGHRYSVHVEKIGVRRVSQARLSTRDVAVFLSSEDLSRCCLKSGGFHQGTCARRNGPLIAFLPTTNRTRRLRFTFCVTEGTKCNSQRSNMRPNVFSFYWKEKCSNLRSDKRNVTGEGGLTTVEEGIVALGPLRSLQILQANVMYFKSLQIPPNMTSNDG